MDQTDFFVVGGTMRASSPSYVERPADQQLLAVVRNREFCYVLTPRQMGKSSLMIRTAQTLEDEGERTVIIDLTRIGTADAEAWYFGLIARIRQGLRLPTDIEAWWLAHVALGLPQRFEEFLRHVVLEEVSQPVTIFIDEIDTTLNLVFRDDFFAAIRAIYNARAQDEILHRLTFVLLGVATPSELVQDRERTPFNIGRRIVLREFSLEDAAPLRQGLDTFHPEQGDLILQRIFTWTNGHPYLTQKLCLEAASEPATVWDNIRVDALVDATFFSEEGRKDTNLAFVQDRIEASPEHERRRLVKLYGSVYKSQLVRDDDRSPVQNQLELTGLVRVSQGRLQVANQLYCRVFDSTWIKANTPVNTQRLLAAATTSIAMALILVLLETFLATQKPADVQANLCADQFRKASDNSTRIEALSCLFGLHEGYDQFDDQALQLFYDDLNADGQNALFTQLDNPDRIANQLVTVVKSIYLTLDRMANDQDRLLMEHMSLALFRAGFDRRDNSMGYSLGEQLRLWREAREKADGGDSKAALTLYTTALEEYIRHPTVQYRLHPVILYDRAMTAAKLGQYHQALIDLGDMAQIANEVPPTPTPSPTESSQVATSAIEISVEGPTTPLATSSFSVSSTTTFTNSSSGPVTTITATVSLTQTESSGPKFATLRFANPDRLKQTIRRTLSLLPELRAFWQSARDQYPQLAWVDLVEAQVVEARVLGVVSQPGAEWLGLDVYFVGTDAQGRPILQPNLGEATIQVNSGASAPVAASVGVPQSDIYVTVLLDISGSMQNVIGKVREAALSASMNLPENAKVSVITFDDRLRSITDFTDDLSEVQNRIQRVQAKPGGATCLFDAVWDAIDRLDLVVMRPQDRRALILFTDGQDQMSADSSDPCSIHTFNDVVQKAQQQPATPIHTIGLCGANCSNINSKELREMADSTLGFSAIGGQTELSAMFQTIMDGLNAQLMARAAVSPQQGLGEALLAIKSRNKDAFVSTMFNFLSDKNYNAPLPPAPVRIMELLYQTQDNTYLLTMSVGNPQSVDRLLLNVEELDGGKIVFNNVVINLEGREVLQVDFAGEMLKDGQNYRITIQAVDSSDVYLEGPSQDPFCSRDDKTILGCKEFTHEAPLVPGCEFVIRAFSPDYARKVFVFDLAMPAFCDDVFYQGVIVEAESGRKVQEIPRGTFFANQGTNALEIPMPPELLALKKNQLPPEYSMTLELETKEGKRTSQTFAFTPSPPPTRRLFS